jgi:hypothetical protein
MPDEIVLAELSEDGATATVVIRSGTSGNLYEIIVSTASGSVLDHGGCRGFEMRNDCRHAKQASAEVEERGWIAPSEYGEEVF